MTISYSGFGTQIIRKLELAPAMRDHDSQVVIKGLEEQITTQQRSLNTCLTANA